MNQRVISRITLVLFVFLLFIIFIYGQSLSGVAQAQKETTDLVSLDYNINQIDDFYWFTFDETFFTLSFTDDTNEHRYAIVSRDGGDINYYTNRDIISHDDAIAIANHDSEPKEILNARLGMIDQTPVWEVSYKESDDSLTYYYINAHDGEWIQTIGNL